MYSNSEIFTNMRKTLPSILFLILARTLLKSPNFVESSPLKSYIFVPSCIQTTKHTHTPKLGNNSTKQIIVKQTLTLSQDKEKMAVKQTKKKSVKVFINGTKCIFKFSRERSKTKEKRHLKVFKEKQASKQHKLTWNKTNKKNLYLQNIIEAYNPHNNLSERELLSVTWRKRNNLTTIGTQGCFDIREKGYRIGRVQRKTQHYI